jgi:hypothetical protein
MAKVTYVVLQTGADVWARMLAIVAAILGGAGLCWQVFAWRKDSRTSVRVKPERVFLDLGPKWTGPVLAVKVYNDSRHPIRVESVGLLVQDHPERRLRRPM